MFKQIVDLHIHSKYARACSPALLVPAIAEACVEKGIDIVATGDFTHPKWMEHLEENLVEENEGMYVTKVSPTPPNLPSGRGGSQRVRFVVGTEISCIYKHKDKVRRVHLLIYAPSLTAAKRFNAALEGRGANIRADGRPIVGIPAKEILQMCLDIDPRMMVIPAHAWTPWFAIFGSKSGYDTIEECFEELTPEIFAIETGLSSDPPMNHRLSKLDNIVLISNSDAHSLDNLGREANVLAFKDEKHVTYNELRRILREGSKKEFLYTIEFYPEEGMYHLDGHRACKVVLTPPETKKLKEICPVCKKKLTVGVLHRVDDLADRNDADIPAEKFIPHRYIVPLRQIVAASRGVGVKSKKVEGEYRSLIAQLGNEFSVLLHTPIAEIEQAAGDKNVALGIENMRAGKVDLFPGYDGVYGTFNLFTDKKYEGPKQTKLF